MTLPAFPAYLTEPDWVDGEAECGRCHEVGPEAALEFAGDDDDLVCPPCAEAINNDKETPA